jgi:hypothetical protein
LDKNQIICSKCSLCEWYKMINILFSYSKILVIMDKISKKSYLKISEFADTFF